MTQQADFGLRNRALLGIAALGVLVLGVGGWAATADLSGAVMARGVLVTEGSVQKVQHLTGGIVGEILVTNGKRVEAGAVLLRLDDTQTRAQHAILSVRMTQLYAERARLESERDDAASLRFPAQLDPADARASDAMAAEKRLFETRRAAIAATRNRLSERRLQIEMQIRSLRASSSSKSRELELIRGDLRGVEELWRRNLTTMSRVTTIRREHARFDGELVAIQGQIAQAEAQIAEVEQQGHEVEQRWRSESQRELRDVEVRMGETAERLEASKDQLRRIELRSPVAGVVHELALHTVGGVVRPGETAMSIVPIDARLLVEARVSPTDIDQVRLRQQSLLRFTALNQRTTPTVRGEVIDVAADISRDQTGSFYAIRIELSDRAATSLPLVTGMPVEAFIETEARTAWGYLAKPLTDSFARALREQ